MNDQQSDPIGIRPLLPETAKPNRRKAGGTHSHKPGCQCNPCKARSRTQEAEPVRVGDREDRELVAADELLIAPPERGSQTGNPKAATRRQKAVIADWIKLRTLEPDITNTEVAKRLDIHTQYLYRCINQAVKGGWLVFDDPLARIEHEVVPKALDTISYHLDANDKKTAIEVFKSTVAKAYQDSKGLGQANTQIAIALKIEMPDSVSGPTRVIEGQVVGQPKVQIERLIEPEGK